MGDDDTDTHGPVSALALVLLLREIKQKPLTLPECPVGGGRRHTGPGTTGTVSPQHPGGRQRPPAPRLPGAGAASAAAGRGRAGWPG